jgi:hypothetical protein
MPTNGSAANLFGETQEKPDLTEGETLLGHAERIDSMARELIIEVQKFREKLDRSSVAAVEGITVKELATKEERKHHPIKAVMTYFDAAHQRKFDGNVATFSNPRDPGIVKRLIGQHGEEKLRALIDDFFAIEDDWLAKTGYTIPNFSTRIPGMIASARIQPRAMGVTPRTANNQQYASRAADTIRRTFGS